MKGERCPKKHTREEVNEARKAGKAAGKGGKESGGKGTPREPPSPDTICRICGKKLSEHPDGRFCKRDRAAAATDSPSPGKKEQAAENATDSKKKRKGKGKGKDKEQGLVLREVTTVREEVLFAMSPGVVDPKASLFSALADPEQFEDFCAQVRRNT
jgi:hypothetical protein